MGEVALQQSPLITVTKRGDIGPPSSTLLAALLSRGDVASPDWCRTCRVNRIYRPSLNQQNWTLSHTISAIPEQINRYVEVRASQGAPRG